MLSLQFERKIDIIDMKINSLVTETCQIQKHLITYIFIIDIRVLFERHLHVWRFSHFVYTYCQEILHFHLILVLVWEFVGWLGVHAFHGIHFLDDMFMLALTPNSIRPVIGMSRNDWCLCKKWSSGMREKSSCWCLATGEVWMIHRKWKMTIFWGVRYSCGITLLGSSFLVVWFLPTPTWMIRWCRKSFIT